MENIYKTYTNGNKILRIIQDHDPESPREWGPPNTMVSFHSGYNLGDDHDFKDPDSFKDFMTENPGIAALPVYLYDHSGLRMNTTGFGCQWDSAQIGWIYCTEKQIQDEFEGDTDKAIEFMVNSVSAYDQYLSGDVWGFDLVETSVCNEGHTHENDLDSCWGFYGSDPVENGMLDQMGFKSLDGWEVKE